MEFRGTKGNWVLRTFKDGQMSVRNTEDTRKVCVSRVNNNEESTANLLLISKAPEMLEMLQEIVDDFYEDGLKVVSIGNIEKAKKLIKQATEL